jgi:hypothetical protein
MCLTSLILDLTAHFLSGNTVYFLCRFRAIPRVLDLRPKHNMERDYHHIEDSDKWEIYVKYREIVSQFLTSDSD